MKTLHTQTYRMLQKHLKEESFSNRYLHKEKKISNNLTLHLKEQEK